MTTPDVTDLAKAAAAARRSPGARRVHHYLLGRFADTGRAPSRGDLEGFVATQGHDAAVLDELARLDLVVVDDQGELRAAYPFSPQPTAITVTWADGPTVHAMCAVDALGMSAMLDRPVIIAATEPDTGQTVAVGVDRDRATWVPETAVVFCGTTGEECCPSADRSCGNINFFTTPGAARAWASRRPEVSGAVLDRDTALGCGVLEFGDMLR